MFNLSVQIILAQLKNLYDTDGSFGLYDKVYDFLETEKHNLEISQDRKKELWAIATDRLTKEHPIWMKTAQKDFLQAQATRYYKSALASEYLMRIKNTTGQTLDILKEDGTKIQLLTFTANEDN